MSGDPSTRFVVLTFPRSGSAWLLSLLNSHPEIRAYRELFLPGTGDTIPDGLSPLPFGAYLAGVPAAARHPLIVHRARYLARMYAAPPGVQAVGFKLMYRHARSHRGLLTMLAARRVRAVHLVRANLLAAVISYEVAQATTIFHLEEGDEPPTQRVTLDAAGLRQRLEHQEQAISWGRTQLERLRLPRLEIAHEELVGRYEETVGRVLDFLGASHPETPLHSDLVPVTLGRSLDFVENAEDVRTALGGTRFEWMPEASAS